jgi:hypothetical protein
VAFDIHLAATSRAEVTRQAVAIPTVVTFSLTVVPVSATEVANLAQLSGRQPGDAGGRGECGSRGRRLVTAVPERLRENARPAPRPVCELLAGLGQARFR